MKKLTLEEVRALGEAERMMDSGELPHVILDGQRVALTKEALAHFKLKSGQKISEPIFIAILEYSLASVTAELAIQNASKKASQ